MSPLDRYAAAGAVVIVGAGPGVSGSLARSYAADGYAVGLLGNDQAPLETLADEVRALDAVVHPLVVDITDAAAATAALTEIGEAFGTVDVLHFNPSAFREKNPLTLTVPELLEDLALGAGALLTAVQATKPFLRAGSRVTVTGSMAADKPWSGAASLGAQKAAVRNLVLSLDDVLSADGIRAVSVTVRGTLAPDSPFSPDRVAQALREAARQDESSWRSEIPYTGA